MPLSALGDGDTVAPGWVWEGLIGRGLVTDFYGFWKAGKTTLLAALLQRMAQGGELAGRAVCPGRALVVSEEPARLWAMRRDELGLGDHVHVLARPFPKRARWEEWEEFLEHVRDLVRMQGYSLVVFDALPHLWPVLDENDAGQVLRALAPLHAIAAAGAGGTAAAGAGGAPPDEAGGSADGRSGTGCAVVAVRHPRKSDGTEATAGRGSGAVAAFVDIIVEFRRYDSSRPEDRRRVLSVYSRLDEATEVVIEWRGGGAYDTVGDRREASREDRWRVIAAILREHAHERPPAGSDVAGAGDAQPPRGLTAEQVLERWNSALAGPRPGLRTVRADLDQAVADGRLVRHGTGRRGDPHRYTLEAESGSNSILASRLSIGARIESLAADTTRPPRTTAGGGHLIAEAERIGLERLAARPLGGTGAAPPGDGARRAEGGTGRGRG